MRSIQVAGLALLLALFPLACDSTEPAEGVGEQELITRVVLLLASGDDVYVTTASDPDGDGTDFEIDTLEIAPGVAYSGTIEFYDDVNGVELTDEILAEADEHQVFFELEGGIANRMVINVTDVDSNGMPVGLDFTITTGGGAATSEGTLRVILSHYDEVEKDGVNRSPETDVDVVFPVVIQ